MLVWRGYGILVVVLAVVANIATNALAEHFWGKPLPHDIRGGAMFGGMLLAAALVYGLHLFVERSNQPRVVVDKATGQEITLKSAHDFFYVPIKFWPYILVVLGIFIYFKG
jgi:hypothetical protein